MRIAAISDIHANSFALEAVLRDIKSCAPDLIINLGDHVGGPIDPVGTMDLIAGSSMVSIAGNHDRYLLERDFDDLGPWDRPAAETLSKSHLAWLRALPQTMRPTPDIFACHGTPSSDSTFWLETSEPPDILRSATEAEIETRRGGEFASLMLCGHSHLPRICATRSGVLIVNPGSVGCPAFHDGRPPITVHVENLTPHARYAIIDGEASGWSVSLRAIPYAHERAAAIAEEAGELEWAHALATGRAIPQAPTSAS